MRGEGGVSEGDLGDDSKKFEKRCEITLVRAKVLAQPLDQPHSFPPLARRGVS